MSQLLSGLQNLLPAQGGLHETAAIPGQGGQLAGFGSLLKNVLGNSQLTYSSPGFNASIGSNPQDRMIMELLSRMFGGDGGGSPTTGASPQSSAVTMVPSGKAATIGPSFNSPFSQPFAPNVGVGMRPQLPF